MIRRTQNVLNKFYLLTERCNLADSRLYESTDAHVIVATYIEMH